MTDQEYEKVMKEIFEEVCSDKEACKTDEFKNWMVACSKANN